MLPTGIARALLLCAVAGVMCGCSGSHPPPVCGKAETVYKKYQGFSGKSGLYGDLRAAVYYQVGMQFAALSPEATGKVKTAIDTLATTFEQAQLQARPFEAVSPDQDAQRYKPIDQAIQRQYSQMKKACSS